MQGYQWRGRGGIKGTENKKHKWQVQNRQGEVKNSMENVEAKELICMTHGHEVRWGDAGGMLGYREEGSKGKRENGTTVIA